MVPPAALLVAAVVGCGARVEEPDDRGAASMPPATPDVWGEPASAVPEDPALERRIDRLLSRMTMAEKVGQIVQPEIRSVTPADVKAYHLGAVLNGGGTTPDNEKHASAADWVALADAFYHASMDTSDGGQAIPVIWGSDAVHGHNNVVGATLFPHNIGLGAARDPELVRRIGEATAREVRVTGLDWTFAPTLAVVRDIRWGRTFESYAEDPEVIREYARAMVTGLQAAPGTEGFLDDAHVIANAKHYLGDGGTENGIDRGDTRVDEEELAKVHGAGFIAALEAGVQTVMASFSSWNGERVHGHRYLLTDVLKGRLGFDGFVVGDWNGHRMVPGCTVDSCAAALEAGIDMFMVPAQWKSFYRNTLAQVESGELSMARLDDAVRRILRVKMRAGLFEGGPPSSRALAGQEDLLGSPAHRQLAREAVRKSLVLLKNDHGVLPLSRNQNVLVAGDAAADVAKQSGGWTLTWQGTGNAPADFPGATSIFEGIRVAVEAGGGRAVLREAGDWDGTTFENGAAPDVAVVVFGEPPYAEWYGDRPGIEYQHGSKTDLALLRRLSADDIPVVAVFVSGRPLWVNKEMNASDAFVAAWLPGSEGGGVADVLFRDVRGRVAYDFSGRLSFSWPKFVHQRVLNVQVTPYDPLFAYGYGLTYQEDGTLPELPEETDWPPGEMDETWLFVARPIAPWQLSLEDGGAGAVTMAGAGAVSREGRVSAEPTDWTFEEDGRRFRWKGTGPASVVLGSPVAQDWTRYLGERTVLSLAVRLDENATAPVHATMGCGEGCSGSVPLTEVLRRMPGGRWQNLSLDLRCFVRGGADVSHVTRALALGTRGRLGLSVADVRIVPGRADTADVRCAD